MNNLGLFQNDIPDLPVLSPIKYENIFKVYTVSRGLNNYYFYNILKKIQLPETIDTSYVNTVTLNKDLPWTALSYGLYGTQELWWLIVMLTNPSNIFLAEAGTRITFFTPQIAKTILDNINAQKNL